MMVRRIFNLDDQLTFAKLSGDYNELHLDALAARRTLFGSPVVHGVNALLWALDSCLPVHHACYEIVQLRVVFKKQIAVGEEVYVEQSESTALAVKLKLFVADTLVATIKAEFRALNTVSHDRYIDQYPERIASVDRSHEELKAAQGNLDLFLSSAALKSLYPKLATRINPLQVAIILGSTRIIGVYCPGKYSLYSELELTVAPDNGVRSLWYRVAGQDDRFGLLIMDIIAPDMTGVIRAFHRPAPQKQASFADVRKLVEMQEFATQRALIVGGSRGLGEVVAKLLAAGGADVKITYHHGQEEAYALINEIATGGGTAGSLHYDVLSPEMIAADALGDGWLPTHLYYFATPPILAGGTGKFSIQKFARFCDYYVTGLVATLNIPVNCQVKQIFCPSSVYVEDPPTNLGEYAAAKAAVETLAVFLQKSFPGLVVYVPRLPRLATDQTSNVAAVASGDPVPVMLAELRAFAVAGS